MPQIVRIFLASPSDTAPARKAVNTVIEDINNDPIYRDLLKLDLVRWDDPGKPVPCSFLRNPQGDVVTYAGDPAQCQLVVGLFRHVFGSPLPEEAWGSSPDGDPWTGTEWELHRGVEAARQGHVKDVWVFRDTTPFQEDKHWTTAEWDDRVASRRRVIQFFEACRDDRHSILRGINDYDGLDDLPKKFGKRLKEWLKEAWLDQPSTRVKMPRTGPHDHDERLTVDQQALQEILLRNQEPLDDALIDRVRAAPIRGVRGYLLSRYAYWSGRAQGNLDCQFVNLDLLIDHGAGSDAERFVVDRRYDSLAKLLAEHGDVGAWMLIGDPGCGKSTVLQHFELTRARASLLEIAEGVPLPTLCVWQRLADVDTASPSPETWFDDQWRHRYPDLPGLIDMSRRFRLRFLLDGLNELKAESGHPYRLAVGCLAGWASAQAHRFAAPLFSVRSLEYTESLSSEHLAVRQIRMARWTPEQMRLYCALKLGEANTLWSSIDADAGLRSLCELPFNLAAQCEVHTELGRPAKGRAELLSALAWQRLRRAFVKRDLDALGLLTQRGRRQLNDERFWREHLLDLPGEGTLIPGLDRQAEDMHRAGRGTEVSMPEDSVALWLVSPPERSAWLRAVQSLGLAEVELSGRFRYSHQLWQEFFAARGIRGKFDDLPPGLSPLPLVPMAEVLRGLAVQDPLPGPGVSPWEEAVKMAVQLSSEPARWIAALLPVNLPLAGRAALAVCKHLPGKLLADLQSRLVVRSRDPAFDLRLRIEAAEALGPLGDPRYREGRGPGDVRYLLPDDKHWIDVADGEYTLGSLDGDPDEQPLTQVRLKPFAIAWAPVTNAEFARFVDAGGYEDERWWVGETAGLWWRGEWTNDPEIQAWRERIASLREDFDSAVARLFPRATKAYIEGTLRTYATWTEPEADAALTSSFGARRHRLPGEWDNPRFNHPLQPVVGVSQFEALAYCRWLSSQCGKAVRLPVEAEWEAAARGAEARAWPWGELPAESLQINADPAHLRRTSPVGVFPESDTPGQPGIADLSGNVWEWTASEYADRLDHDRAVTAVENGAGPRAVRGGSWPSGTDYCRATVRNWLRPDYRNFNLGFRVVCCPIQGS